MESMANKIVLVLVPFSVGLLKPIQFNCILQQTSQTHGNGRGWLGKGSATEKKMLTLDAFKPMDDE